MLYINVGADALIGPMAGVFGEQALRYGLTEYQMTKTFRALIRYSEEFDMF